MRDFHAPGRSTVFATNGLCATSHPLAAKVAVDMLEAGGTAADAAVAAGILLGFCEPQMTGLGGDCFALVAPPGRAPIEALNGSGRAPAAIDPEALAREHGDKMPLVGAAAVTLPGAVDGLCQLAERWGRLGLPALLAPAIRYAEAGIPVAPRTAFDWARAAERLSGAARDFYLIDGAAPQPGTLFRAPRQAEVLRRIAANGPAGFYEGEVADDMTQSLRAVGGAHGSDDFAAVAGEWGESLSTRYREFEILEHPPNGQGATALLLLNILSHFDLASLDPCGSRRMHLEAEAAKLAYDARNRFIADPDHVARLDHMLAPETAERLAGLIDPERALPTARPEVGAVHRDTVYLAVMDGEGMAVSLIYSIFHAFGAGIASEKFGILFQNRGAGFTLRAGHPNRAAPGKRPMHTIIPGMLRKGGRLLGPFGVMGGAYQPAGHARLVSNLADFGMDLQAAIDAPRGFAEGRELRLERGYGSEVRAKLASMGHRIVTPDEPLGGAQAVLRGEDGVMRGASDPRKDGCALGY